MIGMAAYYFHDVLHNWFVYDDAAALWYSSESVKDILLKNNYSFAFYSPLLPLSVKPDFLLFDLDPFPYHIHNLVLLLIITYLFYRLLRLYVGETASFLGASLILFSRPSFMLVSWITLRQYLYPVLFSLIAIYLVVKMRLDNKRRWASVLIICVLCELSFMGKEQFMTLPFVLFIFSGGPLKRRITDTLPYFGVLALHSALRAWVLKGVGGYVGAPLIIKAYPLVVFKSPLTGSEVLFGYKLAIVILCLFILVRSPKRLLALFALWVVALGVQFLLIFPPGDDFSLRYWFVPVMIIAATASIAVEEIRNSILKSAAVVLLLAFFFMQTIKHSADMKSFLTQKSDLARLVSSAMTDKRYADALISIDDYTLTNSDYLTSMDKIYSKRMHTFPSFIPLDLLLYYPQIGDGRAIYALEPSRIVNITDSAHNRPADRRRDRSLQPPSIKFAEQRSVTTCAANSREISVFRISRSAGGRNNYICTYPIIKYPGGEGLKVNARNMFRGKSVKPVALDDVTYESDEGWRITGNLLGPDEALWLVSCVAQDGRMSELFPLYIQNK